ncbi:MULTISPECIES: DUF4139 domain-containing protein [unclassified Streptomyces]|uniref:DUF4139 domain-containing protein n=1 Tax=unclassified Streptomyces TaxID=2593676 RepID=UPI000F6EE314|nr:MULTISPECIES: DUF4139 domain-containing protein [unclassified Streptomyces]AZM64150.1 hypothetical protein DLM49_35380 [Streptomyces sp. WAC 01438]RSM87313.1 hypothetical protein DMA10_35400 [Streptomyces sp. WAC 01420]
MTAGAAPEWTSVLDSVVVYAQGALCRRLARGPVPAGGRVRVTGLPRSLDPDSLRARVVDASGTRVTEARVEVEAEPQDADRAGELLREVERLRDVRAAAQGRRDRQLTLIEEIGALRPVPPARRKDDPHRRTPVDAWLNLSAFVDDRLTALHSGLRALEEELRRAEHDLSVALDRLSRAGSDAPSAHVATSFCAVLTLDGAGEAETEVEVEYGVPGAVWVPTYRLTHRQGEDVGRLSLRASVAQRTGEDWTGVHIALATADLRRRTGLPRLRSVRIGRSQPTPSAPGWREPPAGLAGLFAGYDAAGPRPGADAADATAEAATAGAAPPPAPGGYGGPGGPGDAEGHLTQAYGSAAAGTVTRSMPRPGARSRTGAGPAPAPALAPAAPGAAPPPAMSAAPPLAAPPAPVPGPPQPDAAELDYSALVLCGPDDPESRRGRLFPGTGFDPVTAEYRRRAERVATLPLPGRTVRPRESAGSFDHRYDAAARADIPSDGTWHSVTIGEVPVGLRTSYVCVPSVEQTVYATLVLSNATDQALLAGPVEVTVDGDFLLTASLPTLAPGGMCRMGLGPAEAIGVTRRTNLHESTAGLRNNVTVLDHRVHVELANRLPVPVSVEVRERVPVTSEADVRIEERADWAAPEDDESPEHHAPGTRLWRVELPAGGTVALDGGYEIRIPAGKALTGGNRRS